MRDRLIELLDTNCGYVEEQRAEALADRLLAEGVIVPPVKLGQPLFVLEDIGIQILPEIVPLTVYNLAFTVFEDGIKSNIVCITNLRKVRHIKCEDLGKTAFFTREEAEAEMERRKSDD